MPYASESTGGTPPAPWHLIPGLLGALRPDGQADFLSPALRAALRLDDQAVPAGSWRDALAPASRELLTGHLARHGDFTATLQLVAEAGIARWLACTAHWLGQLGLFLCHFHDVSAAKQAELAARDDAERLKLLADNVPALIACFRRHDQRCLFANQPYARTFGWSPGDVLGRTFMELIGEEATRQIQPYVDHVLEHRRSVAYERQLVRPDGTPQWLEVNLVPHLDAAGEHLATFVLISDITRHRLAERAMRESEDRLAKFMQASVEGIVFFKDGRVTDANPPVCDLLG